MDWDTIASITTSISVIIATWQLWDSKRIAAATFEDSFDKQYREILSKIPKNALLGKILTSEEDNIARDSIFNYIDLCNEQIYLRQKGRISKNRWIEWSSGIKFNMEQKHINLIWFEIKELAPGTFSYLERLESEKYNSDPLKWKNYIK